MGRRTSLAAIGAMLLALSGCEEGPGEPAVEPVPLEQARLLFLDHCAICHGGAGDGHGPRRGSLHAKPPDFRSPEWRSEATAATVRRVIREGRPGSDMPPWKILSEPEIAGLAAYVLGLAKARDDDA